MGNILADLPPHNKEKLMVITFSIYISIKCHLIKDCFIIWQKSQKIN